MSISRSFELRDFSLSELELNGHVVTAPFDFEPEPLNLSVTTLNGEVFYGAGHGASTCQSCGEYLHWESKDGKPVVEGAPCAHPQGLLTEVIVAVRSGRLIVADDLRPTFNASMDGLNYNSLLGQHEFVKRMAAQECLYGPVSNTSPDLYRTPTGLAIAKFYGDDDAEDDDELLQPADWTRLASIYTNLWAYSLADYETWLARGGVPIEETDNYGTRTVVSVAPGLYRLRHHTTKLDFAWDGPSVIYGEMELVTAHG